MLNDLPAVCGQGSDMMIFADDVMVCKIIASGADEIAFQKDLDAVTEWARNHNLIFNATKSVCIKFSSSVKLSQSYQVNGEGVPNVNSAKYLGIHLDRSLKWKLQSENVSGRMLKRLRYLSTLFRARNLSARCILYTSLVLSVSDYSASVTFPTQKGLVDNIENVQKRFVKSLHLNSDRNDYTGRLKELQWEPIVLRNLKRNPQLTHKFVYSSVPYGDQLFRKDTAVCSGVSGATRHRQRIIKHPCPIVATGSNFCGHKLPPSDRSFAYRLARIWNDLQIPAEAYQSLGRFTEALNRVDWKSVVSLKKFYRPKHVSLLEM
ncbi:uncharacterized protein LOC129598474 [Paramacrobiotus metropolitanus]|uniref:uncharacterized protein LOC129598474 n=1 Tax=Paramacrobiotus metropolitanus TaxID=2943436 RepID=UPI0024457F30|nr:uncharacterized protein LOC129598474 [Paramacrobiotus metropolitanus]